MTISSVEGIWGNESSHILLLTVYNKVGDESGNDL